MKKTILLAAATLALGGPALAGHANPWATQDDVVLQKNHETNQSKSVDTPGEDEMRGTMTRSAFGKLEGDAGAASSGAGAGKGSPLRR